MMGFIDELTKTLENNFSLGENQDRSLDTVVNGQKIRYGKLGDFSKQFDHSAQRNYLEEGYLRRDNWNANPKLKEILLQQPDVTVLVKKRMFSSLAENYRMDYMDDDEKLFVKASKILFKNKCDQISNLEKLSKINKVINVDRQINSQIVSLISSVVDELDATNNFHGGSFFGINEGVNSQIGKLKSITDKIKKVYNFSNAAYTTKWLENESAFANKLGGGTGVIELTNVYSLNTSCSVNSINSPGGASFNIVDPYESMNISEIDIEKAISDATNAAYNRKTFQFSKQSQEELIQNNIARFNSIRNARGASSLAFNTSPNTIYGRRLIVIIDRLGIELPYEFNSNLGLNSLSSSAISIPSEYLRGGEIAAEDGIDTKSFNSVAGSSVRRLSAVSEFSLLNQIISGIFNKIQMDANSQSNARQNNEYTNGVRKKMRFHYLGQSVVQPMDVVHIYINSRSSFDNKILGGINNNFNVVNIESSLNNKIGSVKNSINSLFNPNNSVDLQTEKSIFVGSEFPNFLWLQLRSLFVKDNSGTHVFAGVVRTANNSGTPGNSTISVNCQDNTAYFDMGQINFNPAASTFNGSLFDNLTPFKTNFDDTPFDRNRNKEELSDQNKKLLSQGVIREKSGPSAGQVASSNLVKDVSIDGSGRISKVYYGPDGLVYKWKQGISVLTQSGKYASLFDFDKTGIQSITKSPFAGQDVMNVISLLITGQPYNYNTYYKGTLNFDVSSTDPYTGENGANTFYQALNNDLAKRNSLWGNFIPFKNIVINEAAYKNIINGLSNIQQKNTKIDSNLQEISRLRNLVRSYSKLEGINTSDFAQINDRIGLLNAENQSYYKDFYQNLPNSLQVYGNDVSFDFDEFLNDQVSTKNYNAANTRKNLRKKTNFLTRRLAYNVRANEDKNLFIVDDSYDKDFDIAAFESALNDSLSLYQNEFSSVREQIISVAHLLNLEVFADTQGHIRVRPPQYNKMPSSVFYRMMYLKNQTGVQIFPSFLNDLFLTQIENLKSRLEVVEDYLRLYGAILNKFSDADVENMIKTLSPGGSGDNNFSFVSIVFNGQATVSIDENIINKANPDTIKNDLTFDSIKNQSNLRNVFSEVGRNTLINSLSNDLSVSFGKTVNSEIPAIVNRIESKSGEQVNLNDLAVKLDMPNDRNVDGIKIAGLVDFYKISKDISNKISERQKILKILYSSIKNLVDSKVLDNDPNAVSKALLPNLSGNSEIPENLEHLLEDESFDEYGPGSGSRFIIKNSRIRNYSLNVEEPDFNFIEVRGKVSPYLAENGPQGFVNDTGGNQMTSATAIDYDSWRMFGLRQAPPIQVPFFTDPDTQCAPYASTLLSLARKNILRGTVTISGNEYMQPGDVVFIEQKNLLYYVNQVEHDFSYGSDFTTRLTLQYGHPAGEYIPTYLDTIGKLLYNNKDNAQYVNHRQSSSYNEKSVGVIVSDPKLQVSDDLISKSVFGSANGKIIQDILYTTAYALNANSDKTNNTEATIELRYYFNTKENVGDNTVSKQAAEKLKNILLGSSQLSPINSKNINVPTLGKDKSDLVKIIGINLSGDVDITSSPSAKAWSIANDLSSDYSAPGSTLTDVFNTDNNTLGVRKQKYMLYNYLVDCYIKFVPASTQPTKSGI